MPEPITRLKWYMESDTRPTYEIDQTDIPVYLEVDASCLNCGQSVCFYTIEYVAYEETDEFLTYEWNASKSITKSTPTFPNFTMFLKSHPESGIRSLFLVVW